MDIFGFFRIILFCFFCRQSLAQDAECNVQITDVDGTLMSPSYPLPYSRGLNCSWRFTAAAGQAIEITFEVVNLTEPNAISGDCTDTLRVFDGSSPIRPFCGDGPGWPRAPIRFLSVSNQLTVRMETDNVDGGGMGFLASYRQVAPRTEHIVAIGVEPPAIIMFDRFRAQGVTPIPLNPISVRPSAVGFDPIDMMFYYTDISSPHIGRIENNGGGHEIIVDQGISDPLGIVVGYLTGLVYWTDADRNELSVSRLDGSFRKTLIPEGSGCTSPQGIELSSDQLHLFWTCQDSIERAKADGTERMTLVSERLTATALAIDHENGLLYWTNVNRGIIERINLDGSGRESIGSHSVFAQSHGFIVEDGVLFWSDPVEKRLLFVSLDIRSIRYVAQGAPRAMEGLYYYKSDRLIAEKHQCSNDICSQLCFPDGSGFSCDEVTPLISDCPDDITNSTERSSMISWKEPTAVARSTGATLTPLSYESRSHAPGSLFFVGTTRVTYRFTDDVGNTAECAFSIVLDLFIPTTTPRTTSKAPTQPQTTRARPLTTKVSSPMTQSPTTQPQPSTTDNLSPFEEIFNEYSLYVIIGASVIVLAVIIATIVCIACCCGWCVCTRRRNGRENHITNDYVMNNVGPTPPPSYQPGTNNPGYYDQEVYAGDDSSTYYSKANF